MKCWKKNCEANIEVLCLCTNPSIYLCGQHITDHLKIPSEAGHKLESLTLLPNEDTKAALIDQIRKSLTNVYEFQRKTIIDLSTQIKLLNKKLEITLNSFKEIIQKYRSMISRISSEEVISKLNNNEINEILTLNPYESIKKLEDILYSFDESKFFIDDSGKIRRNESKNETNQIIVFRNSSTKIVKTNLYSYSSAEFDISLEYPINQHISMCLIPENSVFCYGNYPIANNTFIIDSNNKVSQVENAPANLYGSGSVYYKNHVYIFGGWSHMHLLLNAFYYDLKNKLWTNLKALPTTSSLISCIGRKNKILLSGYHHSKIYCYDIAQNNYIEVHNIQENYNKIVCGNKINYYVIEVGGNVYESDGEWKDWSTIGYSGIEKYDWIGFRALWRNKIYFALANYNLYEFDLKEKKIKMIRII